MIPSTTWELIEKREGELRSANTCIAQLQNELYEARRDTDRLNALETMDCWIDVHGEYDIKASYYAGGGYSETVRSVADKIIEGNKGT